VFFCAGLQIRRLQLWQVYLRSWRRGGTLVVSVFTCPSPVVGADVATASIISARWTDADFAVRLVGIGRSPRRGVTELMQYQIVVV
jgi:hypothetical protein